MILNNWLRRYRAGAALCRFCPRSWNRIANVLESIEGVGCRIEKTENGWGWQIVVGDGSDAEPPPGFPDDSGLPDEDPPPCGHPGNEPGAGGGDGDGDDTEHPGDDPGAGGDSGGDDPDHPGDSPSPPSSGECE